MKISIFSKFKAYFFNSPLSDEFEYLFLGKYSDSTGKYTLDKQSVDKSHPVGKFFLLWNRAVAQQAGKFESLKKTDKDWKKRTKLRCAWNRR